MNIYISVDECHMNERYYYKKRRNDMIDYVAIIQQNPIESCLSN